MTSDKRKQRQIARDISYASSAATKRGRFMIRAMEAATGRGKLIRTAKNYGEEVAGGADFWQVMTERYKLSLTLAGGAMENIPAEGPVIVVANHPYGILDGLMMGRILSERRDREFRILAHRVFRNAPDLERVILPISFDDNREAVALNLRTRKDSLAYLEQGGAIGVFPGGTVSTGATPFSMPLDPSWRNFTAKMILKSDAKVVPIFFDGTTSRLFQIASHLHFTLRMGLMIREFRSRVGTEVRVVVGDPFDAADLRREYNSPKELMDFLRQATYELSPRPIAANALGHEFETKYKAKADGSRDLR